MIAGKKPFQVLLALVTLLAAASSIGWGLPRRKHGAHLAKVAIETGKTGCRVDVDGSPGGTTDSQGSLTLSGIAPTEHYLHIDCPGQPESTHFISPDPGQTVELKLQELSGAGSGGGPSPVAMLENNQELRNLLSEAVDLRADGKFPEAIQTLRRAAMLDPDNPDLHHELGNTFLMIRDWENARVELLEALRHEPADADTHNGLGYALEKLGEIRPALDQFRMATHLDPTDDSYKDHYLEALGLLAAEQAQKKKKKR